MSELQNLRAQLTSTARDRGLKGPVKEVWFFGYIYNSEDLQETWRDEVGYYSKQGEGFGVCIEFDRDGNELNPPQLGNLVQTAGGLRVFELQEDEYRYVSVFLDGFLIQRETFFRSSDCEESIENMPHEYRDEYKYAYDSSGRQIWEWSQCYSSYHDEPDSPSMRYRTFDTSGNLTHITQENNQYICCEHLDSSGLVVRKTLTSKVQLLKPDFLQRTYTYVFDYHGNWIQKINDCGDVVQTQQFEYFDT